MTPLKGLTSYLVGGCAALTLASLAVTLFMADELDDERAMRKAAEASLAGEIERRQNAEALRAADRKTADQITALTNEIAQLPRSNGKTVYVQAPSPDCPPVSISTARLRERAERGSEILLRASADPSLGEAGRATRPTAEPDR